MWKSKLMLLTPKGSKTCLDIRQNTDDTIIWMLNCCKNLESATSIICSTDGSLLVQKPHI